MGIYVLSLSVQAGPAISRCTQGKSPTNLLKNAAAVIAPAGASPVVLVVRDIALYLFMVVFPQRQFPHELTRLPGGLLQLILQFIIRAEHADHVVAQRYDAGAGKSGNVDNGRGLIRWTRRPARRPESAFLRHRY